MAEATTRLAPIILARRSTASRPTRAGWCGASG